jgi:hypothetical protein
MARQHEAKSMCGEFRPSGRIREWMGARFADRNMKA